MIIEVPMSNRGFVYNLPRTTSPYGSLKKSSYNINFYKDGKGKRSGTSTNTSGYSGTTKWVTGVTQYTDSSGNEFLVVATSDGKFWKDTTTEITPAAGVWTVDTLVNFTVRGSTLYACNGKDAPVKWTGTGLLVALTNQPTDWAVVNYPKFIVEHSPGSQANISAGVTIVGSSRLYAGGCPSNPYTIYVSTAYDPGTAASEDDFSDANVHLLYMDTGDAAGLVACHKFGERLCFFGREESFILDDTDNTITNWGTYAARWNSGTISQRSICSDPQGDLFILTHNGHLYQASTSDKYADYLTASLSQPFYMHEYFQDNYTLDDDVHMQWNDKESSVNIFFEGLNAGDYRCHAYHVGEKAWSAPMYNDNYDSGYKAKSSCIFRNSDGTRQVMTGDDEGRTWKISVRNSIQDEGNGYDAVMSLSDISISEDYTKSELKLLAMVVNEELGASFNYRLAIDSNPSHTGVVAALDNTTALGTFVLGTSTLGGPEVYYRKVHKGGRGRLVELSFETVGAGGDMKFSRLSLITKELRST